MVTTNNEMTSMDFKELIIRYARESVNGKPVEIVSFTGKITNGNSFEVNRKIYRIFDNDNYNIILDLGNLEYINSSGVAILISILQRVKENNGKLLIGGVHPFLHNIFNLMDLPPRLDLFDTLEEAKSTF